MTLRAVLGAIAARWWIVAITVVVSCAVGATYALQSSPTYTSQSTVRLSSLVENSLVNGLTLSEPVDIDPALIGGDVVLAPAAEALGESPEALRGAVSWEIVDDPYSQMQLVVRSTGGSAQQSQDRVTAVVDSYYAYIAEEFARVQAALEERITTAQQNADAAQARATADPTDSVASAELSDALAQVSALQSQLTQLQSAAEPFTVLIAASPGASDQLSLTLVLTVAAVAGLIVGAGLAVLIDHLDDRLRRNRSISEVTEAPELGSLPFDRAADTNENRLPAAAPSSRSKARGAARLAEGVRNLRTSLQVLLPDDHPAFVVSSVAPGDGKSFLAANLAVSWARTGKRVIIVDGDLRRPNLATYFPEIGRPFGLSDLLMAHPTIEDAFSREEIEALLAGTGHEGVRILAAGHELNEPADLLARPSLGAIVEALREMADIVIIDSPPALTFADAAVMGAHTDGVVLLAVQDRTHTRQLVRIVDSVAKQGSSIIGTVLNRSSESRQDSYYYNYYYSGDKESGGARYQPSPETSGAREESVAPPSATPARTRPEPSDVDDLEAASMPPSWAPTASGRRARRPIDGDEG